MLRFDRARFGRYMYIIPALRSGGRRIESLGVSLGFSKNSRPNWLSYIGRSCLKKPRSGSRVRWLILKIPAIGSLRKENCREFEGSQVIE